MSSGSLKQFLKRTKRNVKKPPLQAWKRWCTQILSALRLASANTFQRVLSFVQLIECAAPNFDSFPSFLHSCSPPIVHGNLTCDTIFIQHNGLIKIGSGCCSRCFTGLSSLVKWSTFCLMHAAVAPDAIHQHVKTCREGMRNTHFIAPEFGSKWLALVMCCF